MGAKGRPVRVKHDVKHHCQSRGKAKETERSENRGEIYKFCWNRGEYASLAWGMNAPDSAERLWGKDLLKTSTQQLHQRETGTRTRHITSRALWPIGHRIIWFSTWNLTIFKVWTNLDIDPTYGLVFAHHHRFVNLGTGLTEVMNGWWVCHSMWLCVRFLKNYLLHWLELNLQNFVEWLYELFKILMVQNFVELILCKVNFAVWLLSISVLNVLGIHAVFCCCFSFPYFLWVFGNNFSTEYARDEQLARSSVCLSKKALTASSKLPWGLSV